MATDPVPDSTDPQRPRSRRGDATRRRRCASNRHQDKAPSRPRRPLGAGQALGTPPFGAFFWPPWIRAMPRSPGGSAGSFAATRESTRLAGFDRAWPGSRSPRPRPLGRSGPAMPAGVHGSGSRFSVMVAPRMRTDGGEACRMAAPPRQRTVPPPRLPVGPDLQAGTGTRRCRLGARSGRASARTTPCAGLPRLRSG